MPGDRQNTYKYTYTYMQIITGPQYSQGGKWLIRTIAKYHCLIVLSNDGKGLHTTFVAWKIKQNINKDTIRHRCAEKPVSFYDSPNEIQPGFERDLTSRVPNTNVRGVFFIYTTFCQLIKLSYLCFGFIRGIWLITKTPCPNKSNCSETLVVLAWPQTH